MNSKNNFTCRKILYSKVKARILQTLEHINSSTNTKMTASEIDKLVEKSVVAIEASLGINTNDKCHDYQQQVMVRTQELCNILIQKLAQQVNIKQQPKLQALSNSFSTSISSPNSAKVKPLPNCSPHSFDLTKASPDSYCHNHTDDGKRYKEIDDIYPPKLSYPCDKSWIPFTFTPNKQYRTNDICPYNRSTFTNQSSWNAWATISEPKDFRERFFYIVKRYEIGLTFAVIHDSICNELNLRPINDAERNNEKLYFTNFFKHHFIILEYIRCHYEHFK